MTLLAAVSYSTHSSDLGLLCLSLPLISSQLLFEKCYVGSYNQNNKQTKDFPNFILFGSQ